MSEDHPSNSIQPASDWDGAFTPSSGTPGEGWGGGRERKNAAPNNPLPNPPPEYQGREPGPNSVSIVLPVYNQADHIGARMEAYVDALRDVGPRVELVLVTNACRDDSARVCQELTQRLPGVKTIDSARGGWGLAVKLGLAQTSGDLVGYTNTARTEPQALREVLQFALAHPGHVIKARRSARGAWRRLGSALYNLECRVLFGLRWGDVNGTPKFFPRTFSKLLDLQRDDDLIDAEFSMICRREGYPLLEAPISWGKRSGGRSTTKISSAIKMYRGAFELALASRRRVV